MCAKQSYHLPADARGGLTAVISSSARGNTVRSRYRVLGALPRGNGLSVDRECAGRNATSVKGSSPEKHYVPRWSSKYEAAKTIPRVTDTVATWGIAGVQDHGMYTRQMMELGRSAEGEASKPRVRGQGFAAKSETTSTAEVRWLRSSREVG